MSLATVLKTLHRLTPEIDLQALEDCASRAYQQILRHWQWSFLKDRGVLTTVAPYTTGTVSVTNGSTTVTGSGTSWTSAGVGRFLRVSTLGEFYEISAVASATSLTLRYAYGGATGAAKAYSILKHIYDLDTNAKELLSLTYQYQVREQTKDYLDRFDSERTSTGTPVWWCYLGKNSSGAQLIEIYPIPAAAYVLRYEFLKKDASPTTHSGEFLVREDLVEAGGAVNAYQIASRINPATYRGLLADARLNYSALLQDAVSEDIRIESQATGVSQAAGILPLGSDFWVDHDDAGIFG